MGETDRFEHFVITRRADGSLWELGRGAMGVTYKAFDTNLRADVALKVINSHYLNSDTARQRFLREARAAASLRHPNVATVFHLGNSEGSFFYAMEYVEGETVERRVQREGPLPSDLGNISVYARGKDYHDTIKKRLADLGAEPQQQMTPDAFAKYVTDDIARWAKVIKAAGMKPAG